VAGNGIRAATAIVVVVAATACGGGSGGRNSAAPTEQHLVYLVGESAKNTSVWIADVNGGSPRKLGSGSAAVLSPDGRTVAVQLHSGGIVLVSADGKRSRQLTAQRLRPQKWSPDGSTLYATAASGPAVVKIVALDRASGRAQTIASGSFYGFDTSPDGDKIVYARAPEATDQGICGDQFDLYVADPDGGSAKRLTHDGLSAFPVWGDSAIAFSRFPAGGTLEDCSAPGIWTIDPGGGDPAPVIDRAPDSIVLSGFYGLQPLAWLGEERLLVGLRSEWGTKAAVLDTKSHRLRRFDDYAELASSDGRFYAGSGGDEGVALFIRRIGDGHQVLLRKNACCPSWNR
jgi:hypothetical protein